MSGPPPWLIPAITDLSTAAVAAEFEANPEASRKAVIEAFQDFGRTVEANIGGDHSMADPAYYSLYNGLALAAHEVAPDEQRNTGDGTPLVLAVEDVRTGVPIGDIDEELTTDADRGQLSAMRFYVAVANKDRDQTWALFQAVHAAGPEALIAFTVTLLEFHGGVIARHAYDTDQLTSEYRAIYEARRATEAKDASPEPVRFERGGLAWTRVTPTDAERAELAETAPDGAGVVTYSIYVPGLVTPEAAARQALDQMNAANTQRGGSDLCGVVHFEAVESWQVPKTARTECNRALRRAARQAGRPAGLVKAWQHHGRCVEAMTPDEVARIPGPDDVPLFEDPALAAELATLTETTVDEVFVIRAAAGEHVGAYVSAYDPDARGGRGEVAWTTDPALAVVWPTRRAAWQAWGQQSTVQPLRDDGHPNKPLTAYTVEIERTIR